MNNKQLKQLKSLSLGGLLAATLTVPVLSHAQVVMTANDANGATTSFNGDVGHWNPAGAPAAGSTYSTAGFLLRSPNGAGNYTFAGDSLTVGGGSGGGAFSTTAGNNNGFIFKATGINLTVNNLILDGSQIRDGNGIGNIATLNGNITVTANGGAFFAQDTNIINSAIHGSGPLAFGDTASPGAPSECITIFTSGSSTYNGNITFNVQAGHTAAYSTLEFAPGSVMNFAIGANGVNNKITGTGTLLLGGGFNFDLSGADNGIGDSWDIVDSSVTATYWGAFAVNGFTQNGSSWDDVANGVDYDFSQTTGLLTVQAAPEPSTAALCGLGLVGLVAMARRKK